MPCNQHKKQESWEDGDLERYMENWREGMTEDVVLPRFLRSFDRETKRKRMRKKSKHLDQAE
jgi:hypothetical protein